MSCWHRKEPITSFILEHLNWNKREKKPLDGVPVDTA